MSRENLLQLHHQRSDFHYIAKSVTDVKAWSGMDPYKWSLTARFVTKYVFMWHCRSKSWNRCEGKSGSCFFRPTHILPSWEHQIMARPSASQHMSSSAFLLAGWRAHQQDTLRASYQSLPYFARWFCQNCGQMSSSSSCCEVTGTSKYLLLCNSRTIQLVSEFGVSQ